MPYLKIINENSGGLTRNYPLPDATIIGRSKSADYPIYDDGVSSKHAQIWKEDVLYQIMDLGSKNGTFLNSQPITEATPLAVGDHIRIGQTILVFMDEITESGVANIVMDKDDSKFQGTVFRKAEQLAKTMVQATQQDAHGDLEFLTQLSKELMTINDEKALAEMLTERLLEVFEADCCAMVYSHPAGTGYEHAIQSITWSVPEAPRDFIISNTAVNQAVENGMASLFNTMQDDRLIKQESVMARGIQSILCAPLWHEDQIFGLLYMDATDVRRQLDLNRLSLLSHIANLAAIKIINVRLFAEQVMKKEMEKEMEVAGKIQSRLLPDEPYVFQNVVCAGSHEACLDVGGDYYDFIPYNDHVLTVTVADVTGHGYPSGLLMVACKFILTTLIEAGVPLEDRIERINRALVRHCEPTQFITFFHAEIDTKACTLRYCNAGHNPPILVPETGQVQTLTPEGPPLGIMEIPYAINTIGIDQKTKLVMYTDGITEASNPAGELYEDARLLDLVQRQRVQSSETLKVTILEDVARFSSGTEHLDDVTLSIVELV